MSFSRRLKDLPLDSYVTVRTRGGGVFSGAVAESDVEDEIAIYFLERNRPGPAFVYIPLANVDSIIEHRGKHGEPMAYYVDGLNTTITLL